MQIPFLSKFTGMPFNALQEHAEKVKECAWAFQQAMECYGSNRCDRFEEYMKEVDQLESHADKIKGKIRASVHKHSKTPVMEFQLFMFISEQDKVLDSVEESLNWISYRPSSGMPENLKKDFFNLVDAVITPIEELSVMVAETKKYYKSYSEKQRKIVIDIIQNLRKSEHEADQLEDTLKLNIFSNETDPAAVFHLVKLTEMIGSIADHAENAGDMMRAIIAR